MQEPDSITALVAAAADGDHAAWVFLVDRHAPLMASVIRGFRLQGCDAEDVGQTVWLRLVEHLGELREPRALPKWIVTTTRNECLRLLRNGRRTRPVDPTQEGGELESPNGAEPDDRLLVAERHELLLAAIAELSDHHRELLLLLIADPPLPYAEISERLGIPVGSIGPTRARALQRLRECASLVEWQLSEPGSHGKGGGRHDVASLER